jgi:alkaline phosphatase
MNRIRLVLAVGVLAASLCGAGCCHRCGAPAQRGDAAAARLPPEFSPIVNNGADTMPRMKLNSPQHSNMLVPLFANGPGAQLFRGFATNVDIVRGPYVDDTDVYKVMRAALAKRVTNVILMISDGAGFNAYSAASYYQYGALGRQPYDRFPVRFACSTYPLNVSSVPTRNTAPAARRGRYDENVWRGAEAARSNWTDSAAAGTALSCGEKTYNSAICWSDMDHPLTNIAETAKREYGKKIGVITTVTFSHATPACFSAHDRSRGDAAGIAGEQLTNSVVDVLMGAGHPCYDDNGAPTGKSEYKYVGGSNLWTALAGGLLGWTLIQDKRDFEALAAGNVPTGRVCGVVQAYRTLQEQRGGDRTAAAYAVPFNTNVPTLAVMTRGTINALQKDNPRGFFLMVEGGAIDSAGHYNQPGRVIEEQVDFNQAVQAVVDWVEANGGWKQTLLIITSDHETGQLFGPAAR